MITFEELEKDKRFQNASEEEKYGVLTQWANDYKAPARDELNDEDYAEVERHLSVFVKRKHKEYSPSVENTFGETTLREDNFIDKAIANVADKVDFTVENVKEIPDGHLDAAVQVGTAYQAIKQEAFKQGFTEERIDSLVNTWIDLERNPPSDFLSKEETAKLFQSPSTNKDTMIQAPDDDIELKLTNKLHEEFKKDIGKMPKRMREAFLNPNHDISEEYLTAENDYYLLMKKYQENPEKAEILYAKKRALLEKTLNDPKVISQKQKNARMSDLASQWMKNILHYDVNKRIDDNFHMAGGRALIAMHEKAKDDLAENEDYQKLAEESQESFVKKAIFGASGAIPQIAATTAVASVNPGLGLATAGQFSSGDIAQSLKDSGLSADDAISQADKYTMAYSALEYVMPAKLIGKMGKKESFKMFKELGDGFTTEFLTGGSQAIIKEYAKMMNDESLFDNVIEMLADPKIRKRILEEAVAEGLAGGVLNAPFTTKAIFHTDAFKNELIRRKNKKGKELSQDQTDYLTSKNYNAQKLRQLGFDEEQAQQVERETMKAHGLVGKGEVEGSRFDGLAGGAEKQAEDYLNEVFQKGEGDLQGAIDGSVISQNESKGQSDLEEAFAAKKSSKDILEEQDQLLSLDFDSMTEEERKDTLAKVQFNNELLKEEGLESESNLEEFLPVVETAKENVENFSLSEPVIDEGQGSFASESSFDANKRAVEVGTAKADLLKVVHGESDQDVILPRVTENVQSALKNAGLDIKNPRYLLPKTSIDYIKKSHPHFTDTQMEALIDLSLQPDKVNFSEGSKGTRVYMLKQLDDDKVAVFQYGRRKNQLALKTMNIEDRETLKGKIEMTPFVTVGKSVMASSDEKSLGAQPSLRGANDRSKNQETNIFNPNKGQGFADARSFSDMQKEAMSSEYEFSNSHSQLTGFEAHQFAEALGADTKLARQVARKSSVNGQFKANGSRGIELRKDLAIGPRVKAVSSRISNEDLDAKVKVLAAEMGFPEEKITWKRGKGKESSKVFFYVRDKNYKNKVYLHEIGHLIDSLDDDNIKRGNILGSLQGVHKVLKSVMAEKPDGTFERITDEEQKAIDKEARKIAKETGAKYTEVRSQLMNEEYALRGAIRSNEIMDELKAFTQFWKPFDDKADPEYTKYRYSAREVYADMLSGLLNNPAALRRIAPKSVQIFKNYLGNKPEVLAEYNKLLTRMESADYREQLGKEVYEKMRDSRIKEDAKQAEKRKQAEDQRGALDKLRDLISWAKYAFVDRAAVLKRKGFSKDTLYQAESQAYDDGKVIVYNRLVRDITDRLGFLADHLNDYMIFNRIIHERSELFNPLGIDADSAKLGLEELHRVVGNHGMAKLKQAQEDYFNLRKEHILPYAKEAGLMNDTLEDYMENNKFYSHFLVDSDFSSNMQSLSGNGIYFQEGTLKGVADVFTATVEYDSKLLRRASMNKTRLAVAKDLAVSLPQATRRVDGSFEQVDNRGKHKSQHKELLHYIDNGEQKAVIVHKEVVDLFDKNIHSLQKISDFLNKGKTPFYLAWITLNLGFTARNFMRDFKGTSKRFGKIPLFDDMILGWQYVMSAKEAYDDAFHDRMSSFVQDMYSSSELIPGNVSKAQFDHSDEGDFEFSFEKEEKHWAGSVVRGMENFQKFNERWSKIAGKKYVLKKEPNLKGKELSHAVRSLIGSPDFLNTGHFAPIYNPIFMFSSASIKGTQADIEGFRRNKLGWSLKFGVTQASRIFILQAIIDGTMNDLFDVDEDDEDHWINKMREVLKRIPLRDLMTSNIIPMGLNDNDEAQYIKTPSSHLAQATQHLLWAAMDENTEEMVNASKSMNPFGSLNPILMTMQNAIEVSAGGMPEDGFGRPLMRQKDVDVGGLHKWSEFGQESFNEFFRDYGHFSTLKDEAKEKEKSFLPWEAYFKGLKGRFYKESSGGLDDRERLEKRKRRIEKAKEGRR